MNNLKIILVFFSLFALSSCNGCIKSPPNRISGIPQDAVWHGGPAGGYWFKLIEKSDDIIFKFQIYDDVTGQLIDTGKFKAQGDCKESIDELQNIQNVIDCYGGDRILLHLSNKKHCNLERIKE